MWNKLKRPFQAVLLVALVGLCIWAIVPIQQKIHLGLDLQGGARVLLQLQTTPDVKTITSDVQNQVELVVEKRVNALGVSEPVITKVGTDRLLVEVPALKNSDELERLLKESAVLDFKICPPQVVTRADGDKKYAEQGAKDGGGAYKDCGPVVYTGAELKSAHPGFGQGGEPQVDFTTKNPTKFATLTRDHMLQQLTIFLDKRYVSSARIEGIISTDGMIHGTFTEDQVATLANELNAGALPVPTTIISKDDVGPQLGKEDLVKSLYASIVGLALVLLFMAFVYRLPGVLADLALFVYVLMLLALLSVAHAVLTLPGIAGFVLSIGMAVDANVLIFERLKEELWAGKSLRAAVKIGFQRAFSSVFDSHFTTIVGAGVLYVLGTGTVKGFAYTLFWGTVFSLLTAVVITRFFMDVVVDNDLVTSKGAYGAGGKLAAPGPLAEVR
ncbi:protein translocase subunit SecD [Vulcanimicrobium alpinum]|uniref:Protein translocase subunit SecD n=1 Tax=Vulcanimicrobium alpinum TaxID=3016050 RepID=A0AAN2CAW6_UNVUL|nr:protein translocase subunit SecD [Vulcanimicrobium alpinum]